MSLPPRGITGTLHPVFLVLIERTCTAASILKKMGMLLYNKQKFHPIWRLKCDFTQECKFFFLQWQFLHFQQMKRCTAPLYIILLWFRQCTAKVKFTLYFKKASTFQCFCFPFSNKSGCLDDTSDCQPDFWTSTHWITFFIQMQSNSWA